MREEYATRTKDYLMDGSWFKLVDALEEVTNFWSYGRNFTDMPTYNTYVPTKTHVLEKPDMLDADHDDLGYRFNLHRLSPTGYLNTLKGYKMLPKATAKPVLDPHKPKFYKRYRRLSRPKMQGFTTAVRPSLEGSQPTFLQRIFGRQ